MSQDVNYGPLRVIELLHRIKELEAQLTASICPIVQETLGQQLEKEGAELNALLESPASTPQQSDTSGTST